MTVSPNRPTDGSRPLKGVDSPSQNGLDMPPVLFRLPDLGVSASSRLSKKLPPFASADSSLNASPANHAFASNQVVPPSSSVQAEPNPTAAVATEPAVETGVDATSNVDRPVADRPPILDARPAGRTWAETVMAHRTVLLMLVIVIAAAIWTSRRSSDPKEAMETLADRGIAINAGDVITNDFQIDAGEPESTPVPTSVAVGTPVAEKVVAAAALPIDAPESEVASVSSMTASTFDALSFSSSFGGDESMKEVSTESLLDQVGTTAKVIANRRPSESGGLPSLEDLASEPSFHSEPSFAPEPSFDSEPPFDSDLSFDSESAANVLLGPPTVSVQAAGQPIPSKTPNAITDWLKYAPEYPTAP